MTPHKIKIEVHLWLILKLNIHELYHYYSYGVKIFLIATFGEIID